MTAVKKNPQVDHYLMDGCGRCSLYGTPKCKVHTWVTELEVLREIVLSAGLEEEVKWSMPCYTNQGKNIVMIAAFKDYCCISFFKGALLKDPKGILEKSGENSNSFRLLKFTDISKIEKLEKIIRAFIKEAIQNELDGKKIPQTILTEDDYPEELLAVFKAKPTVKKAFLKLTPGRQRGYIVHFSGAKQSATRMSRIEKCIPKILEGKGFNE